MPLLLCQVADPKKIAIGGHSYGAFMAANLVAHAPHLFACAIAQSGAYNRTLTPFSFQVSAAQCSWAVAVEVNAPGIYSVLMVHSSCWHALSEGMKRARGKIMALG